MPIENFEYDLLNENKFGADERYTAYYSKGFFLMINNHVEYAGNLDCWKIHVSVDDEGNDANLANAWRIVAAVLMEMNVYYFKIIAAKYLPMVNRTLQENGQTVSEGGKQITICSGIPIEQDKDWPAILQEITNRFVANQIRPSYLPKSDKAIRGSPYFSYRHELGSRLEFSIPGDEEDPYADIILTLPPEADIEKKQWLAEVALEVEQDAQGAAVQPDPADQESSCCGCRCTIS